MCKLVSNRLLIIYILYIPLDRIIHIKDYLSLSVLLLLKITIQKSKLNNYFEDWRNKEECEDSKITSEYLYERKETKLTDQSIQRFCIKSLSSSTFPYILCINIYFVSQYCNKWFKKCHQTGWIAMTLCYIRVMKNCYAVYC